MMQQMHCTGWWEQVGYGRQPMKRLVLSFNDGAIFGTGTDMVGDFEMYGKIQREDISFHKQYIGMHSIEYLGKSVGEGAYAGIWHSYGYPGGKWFIGMTRSTERNRIEDVREIRANEFQTDP